MTLDVFKRELARLRTEWPNSFGAERQAALWDVFRAIPDAVFASAVTRLLLNGTAYPPRLKEFEAEVERARGRWKEREFDRLQGVSAGPADTEATPERLRSVKAMVEEVLRGREAARVEPTEHRVEELRQQLRLVGRDLATGERDE
jgi:hypothetical protein